MEAIDHSRNNGITNPYNHDNELLSRTKDTFKLICTPKPLLKEYFPNTPVRTRLLNYYTMLLFICNKPRCTITYATELTGSDHKTLNKCVSVLIELDYIKVVPRRTFVIPFNAYKIDKTYIITAKGKSVLHKLINY